MKQVKPATMRTIRDIRLEKERLRYMAMRTELEFSKNLRQIKKSFTFPDILTQSQYYLASYLSRTIRSWFG